MPDRARHRLAQLGTYVAAILVLMAGAGWPQGASPPPALGVQQPAQQAAPEPPPPPSQEENPGLLNEMSKFFEKSLSILPPIKSPGETIDDLNTRAKDAGDTLSRLAKPSSMATGRIKCPAPANGAPDCKVAADALCQSKGFKEGKSLNTDATEKCSPIVYLPGHKREPGDCRNEYFVTRALCQ